MGLKRVLIIDDEPLIRTTTALLLKHLNMDSMSAGNGLAGLELAEKEKPDLIMLDIKMPGMDGWMVLSRLKANERLSKIPVIVFTAGDGMDSEGKALERGASAVCKKPFQPQELIGSIENILSRRKI